MHIPKRGASTPRQPRMLPVDYDFIVRAMTHPEFKDFLLTQIKMHRECLDGMINYLRNRNRRSKNRRRDQRNNSTKLLEVCLRMVGAEMGCVHEYDRPPVVDIDTMYEMQKRHNNAEPPRNVGESGEPDSE